MDQGMVGAVLGCFPVGGTEHGRECGVQQGRNAALCWWACAHMLLNRDAGAR